MGGGGTLSETSVALGAGESKDITVSRVGDGVITAESSDTSVATVSVSGTTLTISDGGADGDAVITVHIAEGTNYYAMNDLVCSVSVSHGLDISELAVGSLVKCSGFTYNGTTPIFRILEHGHSGDPSGSTTLEFRDIISLKCFDSKEASPSLSQWISNGCNAYPYSNLLQWLNSDGAAGSWFTAQKTGDQAPSTPNVYLNAYDTEAGFLTFFPSNLKNALLTTTKKTTRSINDPGSGSYSYKDSKIFLLSWYELGRTSVNPEGSAYSYYASDERSKRIKVLATDAAAGDYQHVQKDSPHTWWTRTREGDDGIKPVTAGGEYMASYVISYMGFVGVSPAFCIPQTTKVSLAPDTDGAYILQL